MTNDNLRKLYDALSQQYNVGEFDAFSQKMNDPANRKKAYDAASQKYNLGSYEEFENKLSISQPNASATDMVQAAPSPKKDFYNNADTVQQAAPAVQESIKVGGVEIPAIQTDSLPKLDNVQQVVSQAGAEIDTEKARKEQLRENIRKQAEQYEKDNQIATQQRDQADAEASKRVNYNRSTFTGSGGIPIDVYNPTKEQTQAEKKLADTRLASEKANDALAIAEEAGKKGKTNFLSGFIRGLRDKASDVDNWTMGFTDLEKNRRVGEAAAKFEQGATLSQSDKNILDAVALETAAQQEYGEDLGRGYKAGKTTAESIPFMLEMAANPLSGLGKGAVKYGVKKFGIEGLESIAKQKAIKAGLHVAGDVVGATGMALTSGLPSVLADTERRMTGDINPLVHNEGVQYGGADNQEEVLPAFGKSLGSKAVENYSEMFGQYFSPIGSVIGKSGRKSLNKIGLKSVNNLVDKLGASTWAKSVDDFTAKTQWNGVFGEWGEEQTGTVLHSIIDGDAKMSDLLDLDQQIDTFLGVATMGGVISAVKTAGYRRPGRDEEKKMNKADEEASKLIGEDWDKLRESIDTSDSDKLKTVLSQNLQGLSKEQATAVLTYAGRLQQYRGTNIAEQKRREEGLVTPEEIQQEDNFRAGLDLAIGQAQQKRQAYLDYKESIENLDDQSQQLWDLSGIRYRAERGEDVSQYIDALNKQTIYEGLVQGIADNIDKKVEQESKRIDDINNFGRIVVVTPKEDDQRRLYVVRGWVAQNDDGNVDTHRSDQALMVRDENGKLEMRPASDFMKMWSVDTEETRAVTLDELRRTETEKAAAELETPSEEEKQDAIESIQIGDQLSLNMNWQTVPATVQQAQTANGTTLLLFDNPVMDENGKKVRVMEVTPEQLQMMMQPTPSGELVTPVEQQGQEQLQEGINVSANEGRNAVSPTGEAINVSEQTAEEQTAVDPYAGFPRDKDGEIDADNLTVEQGILYAETEMGRDYAVSFAEKAAKALIAEREKVQKKLEKEINPVRSIKIEKEIAEIDNKIKTYRDYATVKEEPIPAEAPVKQAAEPIKTKWGQAEKFEGGQDEIALANGEKIKGRYVLVDASAPTPSHNPEKNFSKSEGFPVNESGSTVNDRDYEKDKLAQNEVLTTANQYDQRALQTPVIVSKEGIVLSGNQRTMSGQLAASQGSDTAYNEYLKQYANKYGFTPDQVATMQHPRVVFVPESDMPYNTETFAKFNADDKKSMNKTEQAVKIGKTIQDKTINKIAIAIDGYDTLGKLYGDERATSEIVGYLVTDGVIGQNEVAELLDGKVFSAKGQEFLENLLMGSVLEENAIRQISSMKDLRQPIIKALSELAANRRFGENGLLKEISQAIALVYEGRRSGTIEKGSNVAPAIMQTDMFEQKEYSRIVQFLANLLNKNQTVFKKALSLYNTKVQLQASGQLDAFATEPLTKDEILDDIEKLIGYKYETIDTRGKGNDSSVGDEGSSSGRTESGTTGEQQSGESTGTTGAAEAVNPVSGDTRAKSENPIEQIPTESAPVEGAQTQSAPVETPSPANTPTDIFGAAEAAVQKDKIKKAEKQVDTKPTDGQKKAGNYKMGHVKIGNYDITIENPKGSVREGVDKDGEKWSITMNNTYGYFRGTKGKDGDHIDVFLGDNLQSKKVFVVDQVNPDGSFDEHKVMLGFNTLEEAKAAYLSNYSEDWQGLGNITETSKENFDKWADTDTRKQKPFADYKQNENEKVERSVQEQTDSESKTVDIFESAKQAKEKESKDNPVTPEVGEEETEKIPEDKKEEDIRFREQEENVFYSKAKDYFGTTNNTNIAGYLLKDGSLLDFSGKKFGADGKERTIDHREISDAYPEENVDMISFTALGNVRMMPESDGFEVVNDLSLEQRSVLRRYISKAKGNVYVDYSLPNGDIAFSIEYFEGTKPDRVLNDISNYFVNGVRPVESNMRFRESSESISNKVKKYTSPIGFYSNVEDALSRINQEKGTKDQFRAMLLKNGAKQAEMDWMGFEELPDKLTKQDIQNWIDENRIDIQEVQKKTKNGLPTDIDSWEDMQLEDKSTVQSVPVTESMRASVMGGVPIFRGEPSALFQSTTFYKKEQIKKAAESLAKELNTPIRFVTREQMPKGHSTAKGYYLNGEVVICAENHDDVADVQSTILHEIVAHKGLREMFGDNFKSFLREVYGNASKEVRAAINNLSRKYGYDVSIATEEYMASIAENGVGLSVWNKIQNYFRNMLSKLGLDLKITDNDIKYILWRSYQHQTGKTGIFDVAKDAVMRYRLTGSKQINDMNYNEKRNIETEYGISLDKYEDTPIDSIEDDVDVSKSNNSVIDSQKVATVVAKRFKTNARFTKGESSYIPIILKDGNGDRINLGIRISGHTARYENNADKNLYFDIYDGEIISKIKTFIKENDYTLAGNYFDIKGGVDHEVDKYGVGKVIVSPYSDAVKDGVISKEYAIDIIKSAGLEIPSSLSDIRFREEDLPVDYEKRLQQASYKFRESYQDSMLALKEYQEQIERQDGEVKDIENAYIAENSMSSRSHYETEFFLMNQFRAMEDAIKKLLKSRTYEDIKAYAVAKHGLERNRVFAWRDALNTIEDPEAKEQIEKEYNDQLYLLKKSLEKGAIKRDKFDQMLEEFRNTATPAYALFRGQDYSGLTDLTGEKDFEAAAQMMVDEFEKGVESETSELWKSVNEATKATLKKTFDSGLMTRNTYDKVRNMFEFYVPLRGWDEKVAHDVYEYITSDKTSFNAPLKVAKGRKSMADDPFATIGNMAESGILQGNRNLMKQRFLNLALNHPNKLLSVKGMWYENIGTEKDPEWVRSIPDIPNDATPEEVNDIVEQHDEHMKELQAQGLARQDGSRLHLKYRASAREKSEHAVIVKMGGKEYVIFVNGNPRLAQAVNGLTNPDATEDKDVKFIKRVNRMLSKNFTTRNPAFILSNMSRDLLFSSTAVAIKENGSYAKTFMKNATANVGLIWSLMQKYKANKLDMNNERERLFSEFIQNGGETGYTALNNVDEYKKIMQRDLKKIKGQIGSISHAGTSIVEAIGFMNRCAEDVSRFSAYMTSRQDGRTIERSIYDAKEISVNFNKKGAGGRGSTRLKNLYLFFNAAVQGLNNFNELRKKNAGKFYTAVGGFAAAGIFVPILNEVLLSLIGDDDDKDAYNNLPDWVRRNNFVIWAGGDKFITIPLPIELRALYGLGEIFYQLGSGNMKGKKKMDIAIDMANQITELLPLNPLGNGGNVPTGITDAMAAFSPDALKPVLQVAANKDFFGLPIYKDFDYNKNMPAYTKAYSGTNKELIKSAELLNAITGGDKYKPGSINANPSVIEHLVESYLGGMGKTVNQTVKTIQAVFSQDEEVLSRNVPVLNRFLSSTDDKTAFRKVNEMYFDYLNEYKSTEQQLRGYKKEMEKGDEGFAKKLDSLYNTKAYDRYELIHSYKKILDDYKTFIDESEGEERATLKKEQDIIKAELVDQLMQIK